MPITLQNENFRSFFRTPFEIYGDDIPFVSPLRSDLRAMLDFKKNPFFKDGAGTYFTATRDGATVGRITAHIQKRGEETGSFGFFDCIDDPAIARELLGAAETYVRRFGCSRIRGNMNLTANQEIGIVTEGHEKEPYLGQIYNPAHIPALRTPTY